MKKTQLKHTVYLKTKQLDLVAYLIKLFLGSLPLLCMYLIQKVLLIFREVGVFIDLPNELYIISYGLLVLNSLYILYISPISFSKHQRIKNLLRKIIEVNNFYYENKELNKIILSMKIQFCWKDDYLYVEVYPNGGKFTKQMNELTSIFETALNMTVLSVQDDFADHTTYILTTTNLNPIDANDAWS
ncbi:hypothetical protein [Rummeliibacillus suwonensis]|uniref:hypothetical protein n=1 Tax=Rummeliibacillus suwonensis TaxID=1306154 RepID=UPI0011B392FC|nr:hypothetical protein [Rummeliibacillus suwonensis]